MMMMMAMMTITTTIIIIILMIGLMQKMIRIFTYNHKSCKSSHPDNGIQRIHTYNGVKGYGEG